jgi:hypothetical protein
MPGTVPDKERKLYARIDNRQHPICKKIQFVSPARGTTPPDALKQVLTMNEL